MNKGEMLDATAAARVGLNIGVGLSVAKTTAIPGAGRAMMVNGMGARLFAWMPQPAC